MTLFKPNPRSAEAYGIAVKVVLAWGKKRCWKMVEREPAESVTFLWFHDFRHPRITFCAHGYRNIVFPLFFENIIGDTRDFQVIHIEVSLFFGFPFRALFETFTKFQVAAGRAPSTGTVRSLSPEQ